MKRCRLLPALFAALSLAGPARSAPPEPRPELSQIQSPTRPAPAGLKFIDQGDRDPRLKGYITPEGFRLEIVAQEPTVINPVGMTFATDGTLFVLEWRPDKTDRWNEVPETFTYQDGTKRNVATMKKSVKDCVKVLRFNAAKGVYDQSEVVLEDELPSSILLHDGWLYLSGRGTVRRYRQSRPGGPWDIKQVIAQGFCGFHHHQVSGMTIGNDGWLYLTSGDDDNYVEGGDGSRATVLRTGAVFRCRPDGSKMEEFSRGWRNPYRDLAFDDRYNWFHADNDNEDGSKFTGCRLMHVAEASDFGWRLFNGARCCRPDHVRGSAFGEHSGKLPAMLKTGRGSPAGLLIYNDTRFPDPYRGLLVYPDVYRKLVRAYRVAPAGSTFEVAEEFEFLASKDPLFRPCQMVTGPDGAIYICDWRTDSGGAGKLFGDGKHGRIYRLTWAGTKEYPAVPLRGMDTWARLVAGTDDDLLIALASDDFSDRLVAQREIVRRGRRLRPALLGLLGPEQPPTLRLAVLGALQSCWDDAVQAAFLTHLRDADPDVRRIVADGLALNARPGDAAVHAALVEQLGDDEPAVRRAVALAVGRVNAPGAAEALANAYHADEGKDVYLTDGLVRAVERTGKAGVQRLLDLAESGNDADCAKAVAAFLTLRARPGADLLPTLLANPHLTIEQRAGLVKSFTNYLFDPPLAPDGILDYLSANPHEAVPVKLAVLEVLGTPGIPKGPKASALLLKLLDETDPLVRTAVLKAVEENRLSAAAAKLVGLLGEKDRPPAERAAVLKALRVLNDKSAVPLLVKLLKTGSGVDVPAVRLEAFRCLAALDPSAARPIATCMLDEKDVATQSEAVQFLGGKPEGARLAAKRFLAGNLPRELLPQVSDALRKHTAKVPELSKLLTEVMKGGLLLSLKPAEVERVRQLVRTKGDPKRGKALYLSAKTLACINCHKMEGVGGQVGPDLTRLWDTHSVEKIMESIIEPSKEIKEGYQTFRVETSNGQILEGLKIVDTAKEVVLRDANGKDIRIARGDIEEIGASKVSLMPDNVVSQLAFDQFIDLIAFLKDRSAQESLRGTVTEFWVVGPFGPELSKSQPPESKLDPTAAYPGPKPTEPLRWQTKPTEPDGRLDLRPFFPGDRVTAYALTYVYSPKAQQATLHVLSEGYVRVWVGGKLEHERTLPNRGKPVEEAVQVPLKQGWNPVLLKVGNVENRQQLALRVAGAEGLRAALKPDAK